MWFKVENKRSSIGQKFVVRCNSEISGRTVVEERSVKGTAAARKTAPRQLFLPFLQDP